MHNSNKFIQKLIFVLSRGYLVRNSGIHTFVSDIGGWLVNFCVKSKAIPVTGREGP
jgi:hypothetical protein